MKKHLASIVLFTAMAVPVTAVMAETTDPVDASDVSATVSSILERLPEIIAQSTTGIAETINADTVSDSFNTDYLSPGESSVHLVAADLDAEVAGNTFTEGPGEVVRPGGLNFRNVLSNVGNSASGIVMLSQTEGNGNVVQQSVTFGGTSMLPATQ